MSASTSLSSRRTGIGWTRGPLLDHGHPHRRPRGHRLLPGLHRQGSWLAVESQFLGNREIRSIHLKTKFSNFVQGDLSITECCCRLKKMANDLGALGKTITDRTLVLNVIRGLSELFAHVGALLRHVHPFPSFLEARDDLILEEIVLDDRQSSPAAALNATTKSSKQSGSHSGGCSGNGSKNSNRRRKRGSGGGGQRPSNGRQQQQPQQQAQQQQQSATKGATPWPTAYNPWTGTIHMWPGPRPPLAPILQPHPPPQAAFVALQPSFVAQQQH